MKKNKNTVLAPCFTIKGKYVRTAGYRKVRTWNHESKVYLIEDKEQFRVLDKGRWKDVSPSQRKLIVN